MEINNKKKVQNLESQLESKNQEYKNLSSEIKQITYKDNLIKNFLKGISEENIKQKIKKLFQEHLKNNREDVDKNIKSALIKNENFIKKINEWKDKVIKKTIKNFINETNHINIILLGKTGVGKSTLINALLGEEKAGTGGPFPVTLKSKYYMTDNLRLWDTQGIELSEESNSKKVLDNTIKIINDSEKKEPDWFIHSIWYCIKGARIERNEIICIEELMKIYNDETMPIIILHLNTYDDKEIAEMKNGISKIFEKKRIEYLNVLSKEVILNGKIITKPYGLKELIFKTLEKFKNSINSMSFVYVQKKVEESVKNELELLIKNKNFNNISQSICDYFSKLLELLDENTKIIINTSVANLLLSCKSEIDYSKEIYQNILEFRGNLRNKISLDEINEMSKKVENELEMIYNKIRTEYYKEYIPSELFRYYVDLVHTLSKDIIWDNLKNIKEDLIQQMKNEIENSPNFKKILQLN